MKEGIIMENNNDYKAVIFDMDGLIFDSERETMLSWIEIANKYGIENILKPYMACIGTNKVKTKQIMLDEYGDDFDFDKYAKEASIVYHEKNDNGKLPMKTGVRELLEYLKNAGKKMAVASSTRKETVVNQLRAAGIDTYFDEVICGDMVKRSKPHPDIFLLACEKMGVSPSKTYGLEDSYNGIRALNKGGLHPIMIPDLLPPTDEMEGLSEVIVKDLLEVIEYLKKA